MTHDVAIDLVVDSLVEQLEPGQARDLEQHLATCTTCAAEATELRQLWGDLDALPRPTPDVAAALRLGKRLATARRKSRWLPALRAAAVVVLVGAGVVAGRMMPRDDGDRGSGTVIDADAGAFLFLIRGTEPDRIAPAEELVAEYGAWAEELATEGRLIGGERLTDDPGLWVGKEGPGLEVVSGFFLVRAMDYVEAEKIALASPHVAFGGTIEVRAIDR